MEREPERRFINRRGEMKVNVDEIASTQRPNLKSDSASPTNMAALTEPKKLSQAAALGCDLGIGWLDFSDFSFLLHLHCLSKGGSYIGYGSNSEIDLASGVARIVVIALIVGLSERFGTDSRRESQSVRFVILGVACMGCV